MTVAGQRRVGIIVGTIDLEAAVDIEARCECGASVVVVGLIVVSSSLES